MTHNKSSILSIRPIPRLKETSPCQSNSSILFVPRQEQANLLVYGPDRPYFKQKQKNDITKFWPTGFFQSTIFCFLRIKKKEMKHNKLI